MEPTRLGPYRIVGRLGRGGMGTVYEAVDDKSGSAVAVKVLAAHLADDPALRRRFHAEIETLKELVHPSIVRLLAYGEEEGQPYFAMELVRGTSLDHRLRGGERYGWRRCVEIAGTVARALKVAHDHGVIHRDLKPANLLLTDEGVVKLADFGIAKLFGAAGFTAHGSVVGTAEFMAPEQARGESLDHRADLYALGGVMFAMLAGRPPLKGRSIPEILDKLLREPPPRVASLVAEVPPELDELIDRMLSKDPSRRPATALVTGRMLESIADAADPRAGEPGTGTLPGTARGTLAASTAGTAEIVTQPSGKGPSGDGADAMAVTRDASQIAAAATDGGGGRIPAGGREGPAGRTRPDDNAAATVAYTADPSATGPEVETPLSTRFTTVENLERVKAEQAAREARRHGLLSGASAALLVALVAAGGYFLLRAPTADELHARIERAAGRPDDLREAAPLVERFLADHPRDPRAADVRALADRIALDALDRRARVGRREGRSPLERDYRLAVEAGEESPATGLELLEAVQALYGLAAAGGDDSSGPASPDPDSSDPAVGMADDADDWRALVAGQIERLAPLAAVERAEDLRRIETALAEAERLAAEAAAEPSRAEACLAGRRSLLEAVARLYASRPHAEAGVAEARRLLLATPQETTRVPAPPDATPQETTGVPTPPDATPQETTGVPTPPEQPR
jgi:predicted Ser/Thr protein kinase